MLLLLLLLLLVPVVAFLVFRARARARGGGLFEPQPGSTGDATGNWSMTLCHRLQSAARGYRTYLG